LPAREDTLHLRIDGLACTPRTGFIRTNAGIGRPSSSITRSDQRCEYAHHLEEQDLRLQCILLLI